MKILVNGLTILLSWLSMEGVAWFTHKYIMHGFLWSWHRGHHINDLKRPDDALQQDNGFEKNDLFFLVYAIPSALLMITGFLTQHTVLVFIAIGIMLYGFTYFIVHDVIYHKRIRIDFLQKNNKRYIKAIKKAHKAHHKPKNPGDFESYGLLFFPKRFLKD